MATYTRISYNERLRIRQYLNNQFSIGDISRTLRRSKSSICDEIHRKGMTKDTYNPITAQADVKFKRKLIKRHKKIKGALETIIQLLMLEKRWSPEQISKYLKIFYSSEPELHVSTESIYKFVYNSPHKLVYTKVLRSRRKRRKHHKPGGVQRGGIRNRVSIHSRPAEIETRTIPGHWEGDLIIGKGHKSAIGTLVERTTRYTIMVSLESKKSESVVNAFITELEKLPPHLRKSLTYDQGTEMSQHEQITRILETDVYFADPGSPWQRGTNENTNGLIREFYPKGTDFEGVTRDQLKYVEELINTRPKKILGFTSPKTNFEKYRLMNSGY